MFIYILYIFFILPTSLFSMEPEISLSQNFAFVISATAKEVYKISEQMRHALFDELLPIFAPIIDKPLPTFQTSPLIAAINNKNQYAVEQLLLNYNANPQLAGKDGCNALQVAVGTNNKLAVKLLVTAGATWPENPQCKTHLSQDMKDYIKSIQPIAKTDIPKSIAPFTEKDTEQAENMIKKYLENYDLNLSADNTDDQNTLIGYLLEWRSGLLTDDIKSNLIKKIDAKLREFDSQDQEFKNLIGLKQILKNKIDMIGNDLKTFSQNLRALL